MDTIVRKITLRQSEKYLKQGEVSQVNLSTVFKTPWASGLGSYPIPTASSNINSPALLLTQTIKHYKHLSKTWGI